MASTHIRSARPLDLDNLAVLEGQAGQIFHSVGMPEVAEAVPDREALCRSQGQGLIWVAEEQGEIAGHIVATVLDDNAHIEQVSVAPAFARQGIGHQLISHVEDWGRSNSRPATTLTTFRDRPLERPLLRNTRVPRALRLRNRQRSFSGNETRSVTAWNRCLTSLRHDQAQRWRFLKAPLRGTLDHAACGAFASQWRIPLRTPGRRRGPT